MSPPNGVPAGSPIEGVRLFALCFADAVTVPGVAVEAEQVAWLGTEIEDLEAVAYHRDSEERLVVRTFPSAASALASPGMAKDLRLVWLTPDTGPGSVAEGQHRGTRSADWHCPS